MTQRLMGLTAPPSSGSGKSVRVFPRVEVRKVPPQNLLASLLKRQAASIMQDVTETPPESLPAHLCRLRDMRELVAFHLRHTFAGTPEAALSGKQLLHASTLADYLCCLELTAKAHRAPACLNSRDADMAEIKRMFNLIAAGLAVRLDAERQLGVADEVEAIIEQLNAEREAWGTGVQS